MKTKDAINYYGSGVALAKAIDCNSAAISQWGEDVPKFRAYQLQVITKGKLKAFDSKVKT